jgi:hypothetical protein
MPSTKPTRIGTAAFCKCGLPPPVELAPGPAVGKITSVAPAGTTVIAVIVLLCPFGSVVVLSIVDVYDPFRTVVTGVDALPDIMVIMPCVVDGGTGAGVALAPDEAGGDAGELLPAAELAGGLAFAGVEAGGGVLALDDAGVILGGVEAGAEEGGGAVAEELVPACRFAIFTSTVATAALSRWTADMAVRSSGNTPCLNFEGE